MRDWETGSARDRQSQRQRDRKRRGKTREFRDKTNGDVVLLACRDGPMQVRDTKSSKDQIRESQMQLSFPFPASTAVPTAYLV